MTTKNNDKDMIYRKIEELQIEIKSLQDSSKRDFKIYRKKIKELIYWRRRQIQLGMEKGPIQNIR